jgi:hypothetical protein
MRTRRAGWRVPPFTEPARPEEKCLGVPMEDSTPTGSELIDAIIQQVQRLRHERDGPIAENSQPEPAAVMETLAEIIASPSRPVKQKVIPPIAPLRVEPVRVVAPRTKARKGNRTPIASANLEAAITEAIRQRAPGCESVVGVIVQQTRPKSRFDANWVVRGVKFGRADREKVNEAIAGIVEAMQREYILSDD